MYIAYKSNVEARSCNNCCRGKAIITYLGVRLYPWVSSNAHMSYCHLLPLRLYHILPRIS